MTDQTHTVNTSKTRDVILESMTLPQMRSLALIVAAGGRATRSNYTAGSAQNGKWQVYWKSVDWLVLEGLVLRVGRFYAPTIRGEEIATQARLRRWA